MPNEINTPSYYSERRRKPNKTSFVSCLIERIKKRTTLRQRSDQAVTAEMPELVRNSDAVSAVSTVPEKLASPVVRELVTQPQAVLAPDIYPAVSAQGSTYNDARPHDPQAFLSDARATVEALYQVSDSFSPPRGEAVTEIRSYLDQHPRVASGGVNTPQPISHLQPQTPYYQSNKYPLTQQLDNVDKRLEVMGYGVKNAA